MYVQKTHMAELRSEGSRCLWAAHPVHQQSCAPGASGSSSLGGTLLTLMLFIDFPSLSFCSAGAVVCVQQHSDGV